MAMAALIGVVASEIIQALAPLILNEAKSRIKDIVDVDAATEKVMRAELEALCLALKAGVNAFTPPDKPLGLDEPLTEGMDVEVVEPTGDEPTSKPFAKREDPQ